MIFLFNRLVLFPQRLLFPQPLLYVLSNNIEGYPLNLPAGESPKRSCPMLTSSGFRKDLKIHCLKMVIKRKSRVDLEGLHNRKARAVRVAEFLIFEFEKQFPGPFFVFPSHGNKSRQSAVFHPSTEVARRSLFLPASFVSSLSFPLQSALFVQPSTFADPPFNFPVSSLEALSQD